ALRVLRLRAIALALRVLRLRAIALALRVLRLRAIALALRVLRLRAIALALRVLRLRAIALALRVLRFAMPLRITFADPEPQNLERVLVRIFEVEGFDSSRILVPLGQRLRTIGCVFYLVLSEPLICFVHVRHNERNVLKPTIVAPRIDRDR